MPTIINESVVMIWNKLIKINRYFKLIYIIPKLFKYILYKSLILLNIIKL